MNGKNVLLILLTLVAAGLGILKYSFSRQPLPQPPSSRGPSPAPSPADPTAGWVEFETPYFTLLHPPEASAAAVVSGVDSEDWRVSQLGPVQLQAGSGETELFDGYAVTLTRFESVGEDTVLTQALSDRRKITLGCGEDAATATSSGSLGDIKTLTFRGGCLGEADYHYFLEDEKLYRLTYIVEGTESQKSRYSTIVGNILASIRF